ncbi:MAG: hypothetical protein IJ769_02390 [Clostridia bacterium]|nr:hypothetical protein [Clostridia bacterium]
MTEKIKKSAAIPAITVDDGSRRVPIHNIHGEEIGVFYFHPTDIGIIERYNHMVDGFDEITRPLERFSGDADDAAQAEALREAEKRLREAVNGLFGGDAAGAFFGGMHPFSPVGGAFYCESVLKAVGQYISEQFDAETAKFSSRAAKYLKDA